MLEKAGYERFTAQDSKYRGCSWGWRDAESPYEVCGALDFFVDGNAQRVSCSPEYYREPHNYGERDKDGQYISTRSEYINPAHIPDIVEFPENAELNSVIILNKNAEMDYCGDDGGESPFCEVKNKNPLIFYCEPGSKVAIDILSKCRDARKYHGSENKREYPEFYNATIVVMGPQVVTGYQKKFRLR